MVLQLGVAVVACGLVAKAFARIAIPRGSRFADSATLATSGLVNVGLTVLFAGSAVVILRDGTSALRLVLGGFFALAAIAALAMTGFYIWAAYRLPSLRREK